jgi:hypothetical protein
MSPGLRLYGNPGTIADLFPDLGFGAITSHLWGFPPFFPMSLCDVSHITERAEATALFAERRYVQYNVFLNGH